MKRLVAILVMVVLTATLAVSQTVSFNALNGTIDSVVVTNVRTNQTVVFFEGDVLNLINSSSVSEIKPSVNNMNLYPNPMVTESTLSFECEIGNVEVKVIDMLGNYIIYENFKAHNSNNSINITGLKSGVYVVSVNGATKKLISSNENCSVIPSIEIVEKEENLSYNKSLKNNKSVELELNVNNGDIIRYVGYSTNGCINTIEADTYNTNIEFNFEPCNTIVISLTTIIPIDGIGIVHANANMILITMNNLPVDQKGFCYSMNSNPLVDVDTTIIDNSNSNVIIYPLTPNTTYYIKAFVRVNGTIVYGNEVVFTTLKDEITFTDGRDGNVYNSVNINGKYWMTSNLKFNADSSRCYNNDEANCATYGRLYNWTTALNGNIPNAENENNEVKGVCPTGYHLPSKAEWSGLMNYVINNDGYNSLKDTTTWTLDNGTNTTGFNAEASGFATESRFWQIGKMIYYTTSTKSQQYNEPYTIEINDSTIAMKVVYSDVYTSVRCVKN